MVYNLLIDLGKEITAKRALTLIILTFFSLHIGSAQNLYDTRFALTTLDTADAVACYDLQISNPGTEPWDLSTHNLSLFYDASVACYVSDSLVASPIIFRHTINQNIVGGAQITGSGLPYEDSLGFLRLNLSFVQAGDGITIDTNGTWYSTINVCFDIKLEDITNPNTCFRVDFSDVDSRTAVGVFPDIVQQWNTSNLPEPVTLNTNQDNLPNATRTTCFVINENTESLCSDNIDNDEDGLLDCLDDECSPGNVGVDTKNIECFDPDGAIIFSGGQEGLSFSIDAGLSFSSDSMFSNLTAGLYDLVVTKNGVSTCAFMSTISVQAPATDCTESSVADCMDGMDNDNDGLIDCADDGCQPRIDDVLIVLPFNCPELMDGMIDILSPFPDVEYSIDSGITYFPDPVFTDLGEDTFYVLVRNILTLCEYPYDQNPVILRALEACVTPDEICSDGIDNDFDGMIDCLDSDCISISECINIPNIYIPNVIDLRSSMNNVFKVSSERPILIESARIYNRWGDKVYDDLGSQFVNGGWDGKVNNTEVESGVYVYHIQFNIDGLLVDRMGDVTVLR